MVWSYGTLAMHSDHKYLFVFALLCIRIRNWRSARRHFMNRDMALSAIKYLRFTHDSSLKRRRRNFLFLTCSLHDFVCFQCFLELKNPEYLVQLSGAQNPKIPSMTFRNFSKITLDSFSSVRLCSVTLCRRSIPENRLSPLYWSDYNYQWF